MKTPEQWAEEVPEHFIGDRKDREMFAWLFEQAMTDVVKAATGVVFAECQPNHGELFARIDDKLRALITPAPCEP